MSRSTKGILCRAEQPGQWKNSKLCWADNHDTKELEMKVRPVSERIKWTDLV